MSADKDLISVQQARDLVEGAYKAQAEIVKFDQAKIDRICEAMSRAALREAARLGAMAALLCGGLVLIARPSTPLPSRPRRSSQGACNGQKLRWEPVERATKLLAGCCRQGIPRTEQTENPLPWAHRTLDIAGNHT